jgi:putative endonuclease
MHQGYYFVYIMTNRVRGVLYTGVTNDMARRVIQHRTGKGVAFTARYNLYRLAWFEMHQDINAAILREKRIKRWRREWKFALVEELNPGWADLASDWGV